MAYKYAGFLASSSDDTGQTLALKVKGIVLASSSIIILVAAHFFNLHLNANDVVDLATEAGVVAGAVGAIYGGIIHLINIWGRVKVQ